MKILYLIHAEEIDEKALKTISRHCPHLSTLGLYNCEFQAGVKKVQAGGRGGEWKI